MLSCLEVFGAMAIPTHRLTNLLIDIFNMPNTRPAKMSGWNDRPWNKIRIGLAFLKTEVKWTVSSERCPCAEKVPIHS